MIAKLRGEGGAGAPVVYVPGIDGTGALLLGTAGRLEERFRLARLSYSAETPAVEAPDSYPALAASVARVIGELGIERCVVIAESFGGAVALQLTLDAPELIAGLIIVNSFARYPSRGRLAIARRIAPAVPEPLFHFGRRWFAPHALFGKRQDPAALAEFRAIPGTFFDEGYARRLAMIAELDLRPRLPEIAVPVHLYASAADRVVPSVECLKEVEAGLSDARLEVVPDAGHLLLPLSDEPWVERVGELVELVL